MGLGKYSKAVTLWMPLLAAMSLAILLSVNTAMAASSASERSTNSVLLACPPLATETLEPYSNVSSVPREMAWSETKRLELMGFSMLPNDNGHKKNKHNDGEDEGNRDNDRRDRDYDRDGKRKSSVSIQVVFGERDREIIREYYSNPNSNLPPGLAKRGGQLPPGLEKQLRRNGKLPPGLQKKVVRFPVELERRLPPLPRNYVRVFLGGRGLIVDAQFNIIDIIDSLR